MSGPGSTANVIAAIASFFLPGLGQLVQGRMGRALFFVVVGVILWLLSFGTLGWIIHVWAAFDAALYKPRFEYPG
jgi:TM2 domain-containing membrane protein YozV